MSYLLTLNFLNIDDIVQRITENLISNDHSLLFDGFPVKNNQDILELCHRLGRLSDDGVRTESNTLDEGIIHTVADRGESVLDPYGNQITSTTERMLDFHTDEYFSQEPASLVLLACVEQAETGGDSLVVSIEAMIEELPSKVILRLLHDDFPCHIGRTSILTRHAEHYTIRFNRLEMERSVAVCGGGGLKQDQLDAIEALERAASKISQKFRMEPGQLLALNNRRSLHARTAFPRGDRRELKRIRIK